MMELLDPVADHPRVRMVSLMDHCPGVGQYAEPRPLPGHAAARGTGTRSGSSSASSSCRSSGRACAARTAGACWSGWRDAPSRWPAMTTAPRRRSRRTTATASASASSRSRWSRPGRRRREACEVIAGAPNIVRGGSHSGNVSARRLVRGGRGGRAGQRLRARQPDRGGIRLRRADRHLLAEGVALVTAHPAGMARLDDRGRIAPGCGPIWCGCASTRASRSCARSGAPGSASSERRRRVALYYAPELDDPLWDGGLRLARAATRRRGAPLPQPACRASKRSRPMPRATGSTAR